MSGATANKAGRNGPRCGGAKPPTGQSDRHRDGRSRPRRFGIKFAPLDERMARIFRIYSQRPGGSFSTRLRKTLPRYVRAQVSSACRGRDRAARRRCGWKTNADSAGAQTFPVDRDGATCNEQGAIPQE